MSGISLLPVAPSAIKSLQPFSIAINGTLSATATITAVNVNKTVLVMHGFRVDSTADAAAARHWFPTLTLTNATTVTATRGGAAGVCTVNGVAVEFY